MTTSYLDNYYARLGVSKNATSEEIRNAYHQAARRLHPDTNQDPTSTELFLQIQEAYETLSDADKRKAYDAALPDDIDPPPDVMINAIYSRPVLPIIQEPQLVYVLLDLMSVSGETHQKDRTPPVNLCLVLDTSTSMKGPRLDMVKSTAIKLVKKLKRADILSIVTFNDRAEVIVPATRGLEHNKVESRISMLQTQGGTEMLMGLNAGVDEVMRYLHPSYINHMILITDGRTYGDEEACINLAGKAAEKGITISGIGIGSEWNDDFLDELTGKTGGGSVYAAEAKDIERLLEKQFNRLQQTYSNQVNLDFATPPQVKLQYAFRLSPDAGAVVIDTPMSLGHIPFGPSLSILMEFLVEAIPPEVESLTLIEGTLNLDIPSRAIPATSARLRLARPTDFNPDLQAPPQVLIKAMSRLSLYRLQEQARREIAEGQIDKAVNRLHNLATQLLASGKSGLAHTVMLEAKNLEGGNLFGKTAEKRIKYGTRALLLPSTTEEIN